MNKKDIKTKENQEYNKSEKNTKPRKSKKVRIIFLAVCILVFLSVGAYFSYEFFRVKQTTFTVNILGEEEKQSVNIKMGKIIDLKEPEKEGYDFKGWFHDEL